MIFGLKSKISWIRKNDRQQKEELVRILDEAERMYRLGEYKLALKILKFCLRHSKMMEDSHVKEVYSYIALTYKKMGKPLKAERMFLRGLMRYRQDERLMHRRGTFHVSESDKEFPIKSKVKHYLITTPLALMLLKGDYLRKSHHARKSLAIFKKLARWYPENVEYMYYFGASLYVNGRIYDSIRAFDHVIMQNNSFPNLANIPLYDKLRTESIALRSNPQLVMVDGANATQESQTISESKVEELYSRIIESEELSQQERRKLSMSKRYKTLRGIFVRSKAETLIDNFYFSKKIKAEYEPYVVGAKDGKVVHVLPDFFLQEYNCVHEHIPTAESRRWFDWKKSIYESNGYNIITTDEHDEEDIEKAINDKLSQFSSNNEKKE